MGDGIYKGLCLHIISLSYLPLSVCLSHMHSRKKGTDNGGQAIFNEKNIWKFSIVYKGINPQIQKSQQVPGKETKINPLPDTCELKL